MVVALVLGRLVRIVVDLFFQQPIAQVVVVVLGRARAVELGRILFLRKGKALVDKSVNLK